MVGEKVTDYRIIKGASGIVESTVKYMLELGWEIKGDLILSSSDGTPIVIQNMVKYD